MDRTAQSEQSVRQRSERPYTRHDLVALPGHAYWFYCPVNDLKTYRKGKTKIPTGVESIREAKQIVEIELNRRAGISPEKAKRKKMGVANPAISDCWNDLMNIKREIKAEQTMKNYSVSWRHSIQPFWSDLNVGEINQATQRDYEVWYLKNRPGKQFFNVAKHLGMLFRYLEDEELLSHKGIPKIENLDKTIDALIRREKVGRVYTPDEQQALLKAAQTPYARLPGFPPKLWPWQRSANVALLFCFQGGARKMEIGHIRRDKIHFDKGFVDVYSTKNKAWREIPIGPALIKAIEDLLAHSPLSPYLFPMKSNPSKPIYGQVFDKFWILAKRKAGIKGRARFHDIRHTFATRTAKENWPLILVTKLLDMSVEEYEKTYTHPDTDDAKLIMAKSFGWRPMAVGKNR